MDRHRPQRLGQRTCRTSARLSNSSRGHEAHVRNRSPPSRPRVERDGAAIRASPEQYEAGGGTTPPRSASRRCEQRQDEHTRSSPPPGRAPRRTSARAAGICRQQSFCPTTRPPALDEGCTPHSIPPPLRPPPPRPSGEQDREPTQTVSAARQIKPSGRPNAARWPIGKDGTARYPARRRDHTKTPSPEGDLGVVIRSRSSSVEPFPSARSGALVIRGRGNRRRPAPIRSNLLDRPPCCRENELAPTESRSPIAATGRRDRW